MNRKNRTNPELFPDTPLLRGTFWGNIRDRVLELMPRIIRATEINDPAAALVEIMHRLFRDLRKRRREYPDFPELWDHRWYRYPDFYERKIYRDYRWEDIFRRFLRYDEQDHDYFSYRLSYDLDSRSLFFRRWGFDYPNRERLEAWITFLVDQLPSVLPDHSSELVFEDILTAYAAQLFYSFPEQQIQEAESRRKQGDRARKTCSEPWFYVPPDYCYTQPAVSTNKNKPHLFRSVADWVYQKNNDRPPLTLLFGQAGIGKTAFCKSLLKAIYLNTHTFHHYFNLRVYTYFLRCRQMSDFYAKSQDEKILYRLKDYIATEWLQQTLPHLAAQLPAFDPLLQGYNLIILDGIDEYPASHRNFDFAEFLFHLSSGIRRWNNAQPSRPVRCLVTSRTHLWASTENPLPLHDYASIIELGGFAEKKQTQWLAGFREFMTWKDHQGLDDGLLQDFQQSDKYDHLRVFLKIPALLSGISAFCVADRDSETDRLVPQTVLYDRLFAHLIKRPWAEDSAYNPHALQPEHPGILRRLLQSAALHIQKEKYRDITLACLQQLEQQIAPGRRTDRIHRLGCSMLLLTSLLTETDRGTYRFVDPILEHFLITESLDQTEIT